jgi:tRNA(Arg) A34 adenosine deaminase TadA
MTPQQTIQHLRRANEVARRARDAMGKHPFGAILVAPDGETVLAEQGNVDTVNHAEAVLARTAALNFPPDYLWRCTLVTTVEPCAMCAGTQYWAHIGRLVYGMTEQRLLELTGSHEENPTMDLPCPALPQRVRGWAKIHSRDGACARGGRRNRGIAQRLLAGLIKRNLPQPRPPETTALTRLAHGAGLSTGVI